MVQDQGLFYPPSSTPSACFLFSFWLFSFFFSVSNIEGLVEEKTKHREAVMGIIQQKINSAGLQQQQQKRAQ